MYGGGRGEIWDGGIFYIAFLVMYVCLMFSLYFLGEYMLRDCSDSEDSFSGDDDPPPAASVRDREPSGLIPTSQATVSITGEEPSQATPTDESKEDAPTDENAENKEGEEEGQEEDAPEDKGDPEMAPIYLKKMLPVFTELFHSSLAPPLR